MLYHGVGAGNCIATSSDEYLETWKKLPSNPIVPNPPPGKPYASWDPCGWLEGDTYYAIFGGRQAAIFKARELDKWQYVGDLLHHTVDGVDLREDISCPDFFKLGDKRVLVCISHRLGARYYVGTWKNEQFHPEFHERMSWVDNAFFAPESLVDGKGRRIMWAWIFDGRSGPRRNASGWSGTMSLPRVLSLGDGKTLRMRPAEELTALRYNGRKLTKLSVEADAERKLPEICGNCLELSIAMVPNGAAQYGVKICCSPRGEEQTLVYYDAADKKLKIDTRKSSLGAGPKSIEAGPLELKQGEPLMLRVYVDKSVVEAFAGDRQAVMRRIYPTRKDNLGVALFSHGGPARVPVVEAWDIMPSNPY
jgi:beta-fructofuranosidase